MGICFILGNHQCQRVCGIMGVYCIDLDPSSHETQTNQPINQSNCKEINVIFISILLSMAFCVYGFDYTQSAMRFIEIKLFVTLERSKIHIVC